MKRKRFSCCKKRRSHLEEEEFQKKRRKDDLKISKIREREKEFWIRCAKYQLSVCFNSIENPREPLIFKFNSF